MSTEPTESTGPTEPIDAGTEATTRRLYVGLWLLSGGALGGLTLLGQPLVGAGAFVACALASVVVYRRYDGPLFDERDEARAGAASERTLAILGVASAVVFPATTALWALGVLAWPRWLTPVALFVALLAFVHVASTMYEASTAT